MSPRTLGTSDEGFGRGTGRGYPHCPTRRDPRTSSKGELPPPDSVELPRRCRICAASSGTIHESGPRVKSSKRLRDCGLCVSRFSDCGSYCLGCNLGVLFTGPRFLKILDNVNEVIEIFAKFLSTHTPPTRARAISAPQSPAVCGNGVVASATHSQLVAKAKPQGFLPRAVALRLWSPVGRRLSPGLRSSGWHPRSLAHVAGVMARMGPVRSIHPRRMATGNHATEPACTPVRRTSPAGRGASTMTPPANPAQSEMGACAPTPSARCAESTIRTTRPCAFRGGPPHTRVCQTPCR